MIKNLLSTWRKSSPFAESLRLVLKEWAFRNNVKDCVGVELGKIPSFGFPLLFAFFGRSELIINTGYDKRNSTILDPVIS